MAKLSRGFTFSDGVSANAAALNNLVDSATILPGAITEQTSAAPVAADSFLFNQASSSGLRQCTLTQLIAGFPTDSAAATAALRTLGTGANQACAGNDSRLPTVITGVRLGNGASPDTAALPKDFAFAPVNLAAGTNIDWDAGDIFYDTLTGSSPVTYTFANVRAGRVIQVKLKVQGYTGTITWPTLVGTPPSATVGSTVFIATFENDAIGTIGIGKSL